MEKGDAVIHSDSGVMSPETTEQPPITGNKHGAKLVEFPKPEEQKLENRLYLYIKRISDVVLSTAALIVLSPLFLLVSILIKLDSRGPVFYTQDRVGKDGKRFKIYKFRSMVRDADQKLKELHGQNERTGPAFKMRNDPRVTRVGAVIRKTCIDELPQLVNIIKGDMTIVGPRPPLPKEVEHYSPHQRKRLSVTPGLTCYWQTSNRDMTFEEWVESDLRYIRERSLTVDISLVAKTILVVFKQLGER
jgi:lipopolysaccharide/colanic/teichoic acid biosynthesis glycosyltransferase